MIRALPLIVGIAPIIGVTIAYWLGSRNGVLPDCIPLLEGCTSISATGRYLPGSLVFKAILLPQAAFLLVLWWFAVEWLREVSPGARRHVLVLAFGAVGAAALVVYVTFLGTRMPFYEFMRRFGIYLYFLGTALAQLQLTIMMPRLSLRKSMLWVIALPFLFGIANLAQKALFDDTDLQENRIEWIAALLMQSWFVLLYFAWRATGLTVTVRTDPSSAR